MNNTKSVSLFGLQDNRELTPKGQKKDNVKIALWISNGWACIRIATSIKKYSSFKDNITFLYQNKIYTDKFLDDFDLIYFFDFSFKLMAIKSCKNVNPRKFVFGILSPSDLKHYDFEIDNEMSLVPKSKRKGIPENELKDVKIQKEVLDWMKTKSNTRIGCVSNELSNILKDNGIPLTLMMNTKCGIDDDIISNCGLLNITSNKTIATRKLKVIVPIAKISDKEYPCDIKRLWIIQKLERMLNGTIDFIYPNSTMNNLFFDRFLNQEGDFIICSSISEGNPLSIMEGMARGRIPITTEVGISTEIIEDGYNGFIISEDSKIQTEIDRTEAVICDMFSLLKYLNKNRDEITRLKSNVLESIQNLKWSKTIKGWDDYFAKCLEESIQ